MGNVTLVQIESALSANCLWAAMHNGRWWRLRRNGKTQTWKTRPGAFRIPVKAGLKSCGEVTNLSNVGNYAFDNEAWRPSARPNRSSPPHMERRMSFSQ